MLMSNELKIERIKSALQKYRWNRADVFKRDEQGESFGPFGMLLRDAGVALEEFPRGCVYGLARKHHELLFEVYGLRDITDFQLITNANASASSAEDMVWKVTEALSGNLSVFPPFFYDWCVSLVKDREKHGMISDHATSDGNTEAHSRVNGSDVAMKPSLKNRRLVSVLATKTWEAALTHRVYSCPDTQDYACTWGATSLLLINNQTGTRVPLNVEAVETRNPRRPDFLLALPANLRARLSSYKNDVLTIPGILDDDCNYRFYFLDTEPWPDEMQRQTTSASTPPTEWSAILSVLTDPDHFFQWPHVGELLWPGCVRTQNDGEHKYPAELIARLERLELKPDTRTNGPAIISYLVAGGKRPAWRGEGWHIHHIFDGTEGSPRAVTDGKLFTHSAGLVAAHPVAHYLAHQSGLLKWLLWREAFLRFGFDPSGAFKDAK